MGRAIAIYGGTFDPPHLGHLQVADAILGAFHLDALLLVPAFVPPHKRRQTIASPYHRLAMLALATADRPQLFVSTIELEAPSRPYTIETLERLQREAPDSRLFFVMGADSFRDIHTWREYRRILTEFDVIVAMRPGCEVAGEMAGHLDADLRDRVIDLRGSLLPQDESLGEIHTYLTDYVSVAISATDIREAVASGKTLTGMVAPAVADYIAKYQLYSGQL